MARTATFSETGDELDYDTPASTARNQRRSIHVSPSESDKENQPARSKGKEKAMNPPRTSAAGANASRKRKLGPRNQPLSDSQALHQENLDSIAESELYDPEQDIDERRRLRKQYRDLSSNLTGLSEHWIVDAREVLTGSQNTDPNTSILPPMASIRPLKNPTISTTQSSRLQTQLLTRASWSLLQTSPRKEPLSWTWAKTPPASISMILLANALYSCAEGHRKVTPQRKHRHSGPDDGSVTTVTTKCLRILTKETPSTGSISADTPACRTTSALLPLAFSSGHLASNDVSDERRNGGSGSRGEILEMQSGLKSLRLRT